MTQRGTPQSEFGRRHEGNGYSRIRRTTRFVVLALAGALAFSTASFASTLTRTSSFTYDAGTGLLTSATAEPTASTCNGNDTSCAVTTTYGYDAYGNKTTATVSGSGVTSRGTAAGYDTNGEFPTSSSNALSQSESWAYDARFGLPTSHTGPNGLTTTWSYDTLGRVTQENRPDGTKTVYTYINCATSGGCVTGGAIAQTAQAYNGGTAIGPATTTYYDSLARKIAVTTQGFDGSTVQASIQYDANGRVAQTSRPYFASGGTAKWTVNTYDAVGRTTQVSLPNGGSVTFAYHGLTSSATNDHSQTTTTLHNVQGLTAGVTDALGHTTNYGYDAGGNLTSVTDPYGNVTSNSYDIRGNKIASSDPDMGSWSYVYDVLGELVSQTDAKSQTTSLAYDLLGRPTSRSELNQVSTWTYDSASHGIGKLAEAKACTSSGCGTVISDRSMSYDGYGRPSSTATTVDGTAYTYTSSYDGDGRLSTVAYPSGLTLQYVYTSLSYLSQIKDNSAGTPYWTANTRDAEMHPVSQSFGNGITQTNTYDANTGLLTNVRAGTSDSVAAFDYNYDTLGNLNYRSDNLSGLFEYACYDALNRLTQSAAAEAGSVTACTSATNNKVATYDALGNIASKTGIGAYAYNAAGSTRPHAVASIVGTVNGVVDPGYTYDADGNMTAGGGRSVTMTAFNMAAQITQGTTSDSFAYDDGHQRIKQTLVAGSTTTTTTYLNDAASGGMEEKAVTGGATTWHDYIAADSGIVAEKFSGGTAAVRYFTLDHLGSVAVVTDESGTVLERNAYDAWGKRRNADGSDDTTCSLTSQSSRGFTNQEQIDVACLVNLNARVYDPALGRFMSADSIVPDPSDLQSYNAYSYVNNGPLSDTDPTGNSPQGQKKIPDVKLPCSNGCAPPPQCPEDCRTITAPRTPDVPIGVTTGPQGLDGGRGDGGTALRTPKTKPKQARSSTTPNGKPDCSARTLRQGQNMIVVGSAGAVLGGVTAAGGAVAIADPADGGPVNPVADAAGTAMVKGGLSFATAMGGVAGAGAVLLLANGQFRAGVNQIIEVPITAVLDAALAPGVGEAFSPPIDDSLNKMEDFTNVIPPDTCPAPGQK